jgi:hypothetical protein
MPEFFASAYAPQSLIVVSLVLMSGIAVVFGARSGDRSYSSTRS